MKKIILGLAAWLLSGAAALGAPCSGYPFTLQNGQIADANQVMANFNNILNCADNNLMPYAGGTFTGTVTFNNGIVVKAGETVDTGNITLTAGDLTITAGSETIAAGDLTLTLGNFAGVGLTLSGHLTGATADVSGAVAAASTFTVAGNMTGAGLVLTGNLTAKSTMSVAGALTTGTVTLGGTTNMSNAQFNWNRAPSLASAATTHIDTAGGNFMAITNAAGPITSFGTGAQGGAVRWMKFQSGIGITASATLLIQGVASGSTYTTALNDMAIAVYNDTISGWHVQLFPTAGSLSTAQSSAATTIPSAGASTAFLFTMPATPSQVILSLLNTSADNGWSPGDTIVCGAACFPLFSSNDGLLSSVTATGVNVVQGTAGNLEFLNKTTGAGFIATQAKWKLIVTVVN